MGSTLAVFAPAKLNLFFEVLAKRPDGFHEVETLVCPISLYDTLYVEEDRSDNVQLTCQTGARFGGPNGVELGDVPAGPENLVMRAIEKLRTRMGIRRGAALRLVKRIPSEAGLGGGSSDAAAALLAANTVWDLKLTDVQLSEIGAELGSDVPLFFAKGPAICRGRGEIVEPVSWQETLYFVVARPPGGLSTAAVYGACQPATRPHSSMPLLDALRQGDLVAAGEQMFNRLGAAAEGLSPWIQQLTLAFAATDCLTHQMTGSGTCCFGLCRSVAHARQVTQTLRSQGGWAARVVRSIG
jgi:4-diphosphocytidyl-2-C-methyl-D-erythritol kinase